jgi:hypothetical protein
MCGENAKVFVAVIASAAKQSIAQQESWIASRSRAALRADPLARNDDLAV